MQIFDGKTHKTKMNYRPDIDGLRAVAVIGVVIHHVGIKMISGGFVGVDVFFVISGFLVGGIVLESQKNNNFVFSEFYWRRARRILPSLVFVIIFTLPFAWLLMTPDQLRYYGGAAIFSLISLSNVWFNERLDYFNPEASLDPLIHTWSLGVEEQFYILFPLISLFFIKRFQGVFIANWFLLLSALSFFLSVWLTPEYPQASFYLLHTRAWEFLVGVVGYALRDRFSVNCSSGAQYLPVLGLILIGASMFAYDEYVVWPGVLTLLPVFGAILILVYGGGKDIGSRILGVNVLVFLGLLSYSIYLWHQPIISFVKIYIGRPLDMHQRGLIIVSIMILAALTYFFVEKPFRFRWYKTISGKIALFSALALVIVFAIIGNANKGYPSRMSANVSEILSWRNSVSPSYKKCIGGRKEGARLDPEAACVHGAEGVPPTIALWGDSHAAVLASSLGIALKPYNSALKELTASSCAPISRVVNTATKRAEYCATHNRLMLDYIVNSAEIKKVVIVAFWNSYFESKDYDNGIGFILPDLLVATPIDVDGRELSDAQRIEKLIKLIKEDVRRLSSAGKEVLIVSSLPAPGFDLPDRMGRMIWLGQDVSKVSKIPLSAFMSYSAQAMTGLRAAVKDIPGAAVLEIHNTLCTKEYCNLVKDGLPLYFDSNHLSMAGVSLVVPTIADAILSRR